MCVLLIACAVVDRICFAGVSFHDELRCVFVRHAIVTCGVVHCGDVTSANEGASVSVFACVCMHKVMFSLCLFGFV